MIDFPAFRYIVACDKDNRYCHLGTGGQNTPEPRQNTELGTHSMQSGVSFLLHIFCTLLGIFITNYCFIFQGQNSLRNHFLIFSNFSEQYDQFHISSSCLPFSLNLPSFLLPSLLPLIVSITVPLLFFFLFNRLITEYQTQPLFSALNVFSSFQYWLKK